MYTCGCGSKYIGETKRRVGVRGKEHAREGSKIREHTDECEKSGGFSLLNFSILARGLRGQDSRKKYETFYIQWHVRRELVINTCEKSREIVLY